jgi:hypothetical protein
MAHRIGRQMTASPQTTPPQTRRARLLTVLLINVLVLLALEGLASTITVVRLGIERMRPLGERINTRYDPELGWVSVPNLAVPDLYGPGAFLRTNAQGFRNSDRIAAAIPPGRVRVVCSGDSFTLGYGVSNDQAWCNRLAALDARIESVNMGQGGYGLDQAYLWYRRDGVAIAHDVQIFAFITVDFGRMRDASFLGYPKPVLAVEGGRLVTRNVPVPERSALRATLREMVRTAATFRTVQLLQSWLPPPASSRASSDDAADPMRPVVASVFQSLSDLHRQRGSVLALVYLPMRPDYAENQADAWRRFVREQAERDQVAFIDLVDDLRTVPPKEIDGYFIKPGDSPYGRGAGHYSVQGNDFIARALYRRLIAIEAVAARLDRAAGVSALSRGGTRER